jgi:cell division protein FtsQ
VSEEKRARKSTGNVRAGERRKNRHAVDVAQKAGGNRRTGKREVPSSPENVRDGNRGNRRIRRRPEAEDAPVDFPVDTGGPDEIGAPPKERAITKLVPLLKGAVRGLAVLATIGAVLWGAKLVYHYALTSTYFALQHVEINGNERLSNGEVLEAAGIQMDQNIFEVRLSEVVRRLEETPWVVDARVSQKLPKTIRIDIVERKPEMLVLFDVPYLVDESGEIFKRWVPGDPMPECVITGVTRRELAEDPEDTQQIILDAISLRNRYDAVGNHRYAKLYEIHREIDGGFSLTVGKSPFYVKLGKPPYREKLNRIAQLFAKLSKGSREPLIVYFDNEKRPDRVTVKFKPRP